ncbi:uncharacterized protein LOC122403875 [Colletes gigas]|uniref:uncharacterized protein LOC122403875 n=1 Tax=Colletes gigas TaxID=935657 RepID=UPI001C9B9E8E|nr:uncharacterized protein LOC122403875 [Colletes gigas]
MYRQFLIRPEDRRYQRILWRDNDDKIKTYELNTVTFGLSPAPFLAIRSIQQLADDERVEAPVAATVLQRDLYVDDLLTGADTYTEAINLRERTIRLLKLGGLHIRQWASNEPRLLTGLPVAQIHTKYFGDTTVKTLGVSWHARDDHITYSVDPNIETRVTKRTILSTIAKIFDPLGLLAPVITTAKLLMQQLWQLQLAWDESLPASIHTELTTYVKELPLLNRTSFERHVCQRAMHAVELHGFCDAMVLSWLRKEPCTLKTFVANRVSEIQQKTGIAVWHHVQSGDNPADLISPRTVICRIFKRFSLASRTSMARQQRRGLAQVTIHHHLRGSGNPFARMFRDHNRSQRRNLESKGSRRELTLSAEEIHYANEQILRLVQASSFDQEIRDLKTGRSLHTKSRLLPLHPFLDDKGLLRVSGRLQNATVPFDQKHPILLPKNNYITDLILRQAHVEGHHSGGLRVNPPAVHYLMGALPAARVSECRPFYNSGVDYCGPFHIKEKRFRNRNRLKIYVAVFICFATKAVHLEVVGDMTTEAFIAALKRFVARRGICRNIYSDNGTNFVGASNEMAEVHQTLENDEKFNTFAIEVEAILNSRPLTPVSSDPNDPSALTLAHFLIGTSLTSIPETDFSNLPSNRLSNWQHIQKVKQDFWTRWHKEYIHQLNVRTRWIKGSHEIKEGSLIILKDDHLPPLQWHLGRVEEVHPGADNIIRAVTVRTNQGTYRRNVKQLALLPIPNEEPPQR